MADRTTTICVVFIVLGLALLIAGLVLIPVFPKILEKKIHDEVKFENGTRGYDNLADPPVGTRKYYLFNLTNLDDVINNGSKPVVKELGPYTYRKERTRVVAFQDNNTKLYYRETAYHYFEPDQSNGDAHTDVVIALNIPFLSLAIATQQAPADKRAAMAGLLAQLQVKLFRPYTVHEYIWGYTDAQATPLKMQGILPTDRFGLFRTSNGTAGSEYVVHTGTADIDKVNDLYSYDGATLMKYWTSDAANAVYGSDATQYHPFLEKSDILTTFNPDTCRKYRTIYQEDVEVEGIDLLRFTLDPIEVDSAKVRPENAGYCLPTSTYCLPTGLVNLLTCTGLPLVASYPHFHLASDDVRSGVDGTHPILEEHQVFVDIEPTTGITLRGRKRFQINMMITPLDALADTQVEAFKTPVFYPMIWLEDGNTITPEDAETFKEKITRPILIITVLQYVLVAVGAVLTLVFLIILVLHCCRASKQDMDINK